MILKAFICDKCGERSLGQRTEVLVETHDGMMERNEWWCEECVKSKKKGKDADIAELLKSGKIKIKT